ncbi:MAG: GtrA family protein [Vulcanimicrobiaceae bacterium]
MPEFTGAAGSLLGRLRQQRGIRQFVKFAIVGSSGFVVNGIVFTLLQLPLAIEQRQAWYYLIFSVAFMAGGISNYFLNRVWTFRSTGHALGEGAKFLTVSAIALCVSLLVSFAAAPLLGKGHKLWFVSTCAGIVVNFFVNKYWTFRSVL